MDGGRVGRGGGRGGADRSGTPAGSGERRGLRGQLGTTLLESHGSGDTPDRSLVVEIAQLHDAVDRRTQRQRPGSTGRRVGPIGADLVVDVLEPARAGRPRRTRRASQQDGPRGDPGFAGCEHRRGVRCLVVLVASRRLARRQHQHACPLAVLGDLGRRRKSVGDRPKEHTRGRFALLRRQLAELRHDKTVAGPGRGDVENPAHLASALDALALLEIGVALWLEVARRRPGQLGLELDRKATVFAVDDRLAPSCATLQRTAHEHDDGVFEALGLVDGEQVDHVAVVVDLRLLLAGRVAGFGGPRQKGAEAAAAGVDKGPRAFDELLEVRDGLGRARAGRGKELPGMDESRQLRDQLVRFDLCASHVQVAQHGEGSRDRVVAGGLRRLEQVKSSTRVPKQEQLVVAESKERRVQGAVEGRAVAGVVYRPQAEQRVVDLAAPEIRFAAVYPVGHAGLAKRLFVGLEAGGRAKQQGDVAPAQRAQTFRISRDITVLHLPALGVGAVHAGEQRRHGARLVATSGVGLSGLARVGPTEQDRDLGQGDRWTGSGERRAERLDGLVAGLPALLLVAVEHAGEDLVDPIDDAGCGAEVLTNGQDFAGAAWLSADARLHPVVQRDVGAAKAVDRLLGVAHYKELAGLKPGEPPVGREGLALAQKEGDLGLQGVGILELVDQQVAETALQRTPRRAVVAQQVAQAAQEVGEVEATEGELRVAGPARERIGDRHGEPGQEDGVLFAQRHDGGDEVAVARLQLVLTAPGLVPVALGAAGRRL